MIVHTCKCHVYTFKTFFLFDEWVSEVENGCFFFFFFLSLQNVVSSFNLSGSVTPPCYFKVTKSLYKKKKKESVFSCFDCESVEHHSSCLLLCLKSAWILNAELTYTGKPYFNVIDGEHAHKVWWEVRCKLGTRSWWDWATSKANPCVKGLFWGSPALFMNTF